jgi:hypothetical protein
MRLRASGLLLVAVPRSTPNNLSISPALRANCQSKVRPTDYALWKKPDHQNAHFAGRETVN